MNVLALLQSLLGPLTQNNRLIRLHTPLGPNVLVAERLTVLDAVGPTNGSLTGPDSSLPESTPAGWDADLAGLRMEVDALSADGHLELKTLIGQPVRVDLLTDSGERTWSAHVSHVANLGSDGGLARYRLTLQPWLAFLHHRIDSFVFQGMTVPEIIDAVLQDHVGQNLGSSLFSPQWRWELEDPSSYPQRSLCTQYEESDLAFVQRLCREEGIVFWFEHDGETHTLVLADHPGAFATNPQAQVRYTGLNQKSGGPFADDSLQRVHERRSLHANALHAISRDHRSTQLRPVQALQQSAIPLTLADMPGLYAYPTQAAGERLVQRQLEALTAHSQLARAAGPWRQAAPATRVTLTEHPRKSLNGAELLITATLHRARNNVSADQRAGLVNLDRMLGMADSRANEDDTPLHHAELRWVPAALGYRAIGWAPGQPLKRPTVHGLQTAIVVGDAGAPVHTDRDHRIQVQFHWQRGSQSSSRLPHPSGDDNAPANVQSGTWVRVARSVAGSNWGAVAVPRVGQEVLVAFTGGHIDRPIVVGSVYNAPGQENAQGATVTQGAATSHGASPAWFPGDRAEGALQAHQHGAVLSGIKTQAMSTSSTGLGGYNQLVLDDSPDASRLELSTTQSKTRLQLGSLIHQDDNRRLNLRGHGFDLSTEALGAVRAGSGLLISTYAKPGSSQGAARQLDSREAQAQVDQAQELLHTLAVSSQAHQAKGDKEPALPQTQSAEGPALPNQQGLKALSKSLAGTQKREGGDDEQFGGGTGTISAWTRPDLLLTSPAAIGSFTPAHAVLSSGNTATSVAGQDLQRVAQGALVTTVKGDITLYTYGRASNAKKPTQTIGIQLHAAQGSLHLASLKGKASLHADKSVSVASSQGMVRILAPKSVLLTAGGSAIKLEPGKITLMSDGKVDFKASMKELTSAGGGSGSVSLKQASELKGCAKAVQQAATGAAV
jgi:type VI secretion system secreted protein VgrG